MAAVPADAQPAALRVAIGSHSCAGRKPVNQDFHAACRPDGRPLRSKGIAVALADGISSSEVSQIASESAVAALIEDYYSTSEAWTVKTSVERVLAAVNGWLYAQTRLGAARYDRERGYVCTLTAVVFHSTTAHVFHIGDACLWRLRGATLERLTALHRLRLSAEESVLSRALGAEPQVEIDYQALPLEAGDIFILAVDGVHEYIAESDLTALLRAHAGSLDDAACAIVRHAYARGSPDNLTVQLVRIDALPEGGAHEMAHAAQQLPPPPALREGLTLDRYTLLRALHRGSRSQVWLARDTQTESLVALKALATEQQSDPGAVERLLMEEWIARRVHSRHVVRAAHPAPARTCLYAVTEYVDGESLAQWMRDHPRPALEAVRRIAADVAKGLRALHRAEMVHQDLRPENILLDADGVARIIDLGAVRVAGLVEATGQTDEPLPGTEQYTAPECLLGETASARSDLFALGVLVYQMLTGSLPYGIRAAQARSRAAQYRLTYAPARHAHPDVPAWMDDALRRAVHPDPNRRQQDVDEFVEDLRRPSQEALRAARPALIARDPLRFWKGLSVCLGLTVLALLGWLSRR